jgi:hypothetical protein
MNELKERLARAGMIIHRDMKAPVDVIEDHQCVAKTQRYTEIDKLAKGIAESTATNFSFYQQFSDSGMDFIRYDVW